MLQINKKKFRLLFLLIFCVFSVYVLFFSNYSFTTKWRLEREKRELLDSINLEMKRTDTLLYRIQLLENDTFEIEKVAREHYGLIKEGEEIYVVPKEKTE